MISDYLIQIVLIIIAVVIEGFVLTNLPEGATRKKFFSVAMALVIVGSLVWVAYEYGQNSVVAPEVEIEVTRPVPVESTRVVTETVSVEVTRIVPIEVTTLVDNPQEVSVEVTQEVTRIVTETVPIEVVVTGTPTITVETESVTPTLTTEPSVASSELEAASTTYIAEIPDPTNNNLNGQRRVHETAFFLETAPTTGSFLVFDTKEVSHPNQIYINDEFVGVNPGRKNNSSWETVRVFVPASILVEGTNILKYTVGYVVDPYWGDWEFDGHYADNFVLEVNSAQVPSQEEITQIDIANEPVHIGDGTVNEWEDPVGKPSYTTFFSLPYQPSLGALLSINSFHVKCANAISINEEYLGNVPGMYEQVWAGDVDIFVPQEMLVEGGNQLRIDSTSCNHTSGLDDFMVKSLTIMIDDQTE